ncbi:hypothetical protein Q8A67_003729 [Cirrhinus molitorella]|uniref:FIIND domain-containing protein n=2 Tax=Cirrhinus molitorella TaxID=172907 RepID=A0AA88TWK0_9TELE|nr:hypothetical protein Q8A67_003729 [Cirrhinus molitorella]
MSLEGALKTKLILQECHFTWSLREEEDFVLCDLLNRLEEQIQLECKEARVTRAYSSLGFVQYLYGNQQEALANLQKSVALAKEHYKDSDEVLIATYGDLAWLHYHMNEFSKCEDYLKELERIRRKFSEGFTYSVELYYKRSEQLAIYHFMQGLRLQPKSDEGKECEKNLKKIIERRINRLKNPDDSMVCVIEGFIHEVKGEKFKAREFYEKALKNGYNLGESPLLTETRIWLMSFSETEKSVLNLVFDHGVYDEAGSGRLKTFKDISDEDSQSPLDMLKKLDLKDYLFTPEVILQEGQRKYRLQCSHAGWFHCEFTQLGFNMEQEGEVLYSTDLQDSNCPVPANYFQAGPVYDIKCVQGELSQLRLPHCETSIEDAYHFMSVIHYSKQIVDILKPQNITSTHVTVEKCNKDYTLIQTACECMLKYKCVYSMSCDPVEEHGVSERPITKIQPTDTKLRCTKQWKHYYPTFDIKLPDGVMNVGLHLKKENKKGEVKVVWSRDITLTDYTTENRRPSLSTDEQRVSFLRTKKVELIQRKLSQERLSKFAS